MGCGSSKKIFGANSLRKKLDRPFPQVIEDLLLTNGHNQFVALICKTNNVAKKFDPTEPENTLPFISKDNEGDWLMSVESHVRRDLDQQLGILLKDTILEKQKDAEGESEENKPTEEDKTQIINTWELMEGLDDGETCHVPKKIETDRYKLPSNCGDICERLIDKSPPTSISGRSKSLESFHTVEEYDDILARSKKPLWNRNSKMHLYYLGHDHLNKFSSTSLARTSSCTRLSVKERHMAPIVIDWKEDPKDEDDSTLDIPVLLPSFELMDMKDDADSQENKIIQLTVPKKNNGIAQTVSENNGSQEDDHSAELILGKTDMVERNSEKVQSTEIKSSKRRMQLRAKINDLGGIIIPTNPDFSAIGSLKEWLHDGGHIYSPYESTTPSFGYSGFGDKWSKLNVAGSSSQLSSEEAKLKTYSSPVLSTDGTLANNEESSIYSDFGNSAIENKQWDHLPFDPELLASLEKDLEQLSREEQHLLRQIDGDSKMLCRMFCAKDNEDVLHSSGKPAQGTHMESNFPYVEEGFSIQAPWILEIAQKHLGTGPLENYSSAFHS